MTGRRILNEPCLLLDTLVFMCREFLSLSHSLFEKKCTVACATKNKQFFNVSILKVLKELGLFKVSLALA